MKIADGNWTVLYRDPLDGSFWERTFTQGEMGGGPSKLTRLSAKQVREHYPAVEQR